MRARAERYWFAGVQCSTSVLWILQLPHWQHLTAHKFTDIIENTSSGQDPPTKETYSGLIECQRTDATLQTAREWLRHHQL